MYDDAKVLAMHPRQQAVLMPIPAEARQAVVNRAHLLQNLQGGVFSGALWLAARDLDRVGGDLDRMEAMDRADNRSALRACAHGGCSACARDL